MSQPLARPALLLLLAAALAVPAAAPPARAQTPSVPGAEALVLGRGRVTDQMTGAGVANAVVRLAGTEFWGLTDAQGGFVLGYVPAGTYAVEVRHPDYVPRNPRLAVGEPLLDLKVLKGPSMGMATGAASVAVQVVDEAGRPVPGAAVVSARGTRGARTDAGGVAFLSSLPGGADTLRILAPGMDPAQETVTLGEEPGSARVTLRSRTVRLAQVEATATPAARGPGMGGFENRRRTGRGTYLDRAAIEAKRPLRFTDVLRGVPGLRLQPGPGGTNVPVFAGASPASIVGTPSATGTQIISNAPPTTMAQPAPGMTDGGDALPASAGSNSNCQVHYYVDGQLQSVAGSTGRYTPNRETVMIDQLVDVRTVEAVEIYRSSSTAPAEYKRLGADCGVIVIWTRR